MLKKEDLPTAPEQPIKISYAEISPNQKKRIHIIILRWIDRTKELGIGCTIDGIFYERENFTQVSETHLKYLMRKDEPELIEKMPEHMVKSMLNSFITHFKEYAREVLTSPTNKERVFKEYVSVKGRL